MRFPLPLLALAVTLVTLTGCNADTIPVAKAGSTSSGTASPDATEGSTVRMAEAAERARARLTSCARWDITEADGTRRVWRFTTDGFVDHRRGSAYDIDELISGAHDRSRWSVDGERVLAMVAQPSGHVVFEATVRDGRLVDGVRLGAPSAAAELSQWSAVCVSGART